MKDANGKKYRINTLGLGRQFKEFLIQADLIKKREQELFAAVRKKQELLNER
ncbi:MAG: hypothetical protein QNL04_09505 [SAR324 cluster bacterium]|nr:hypothetical protein [SAR324 cluster bacterium]